jgi:hypothetical protein
MTGSGIISSGASLNPFLLIISGVGVSLAAACRKVEPRLATKKKMLPTEQVSPIKNYLIKFDLICVV